MDCCYICDCDSQYNATLTKRDMFKRTGKVLAEMIEMNKQKQSIEKAISEQGQKVCAESNFQCAIFVSAHDFLAPIFTRAAIENVHTRFIWFKHNCYVD